MWGHKGFKIVIHWGSSMNVVSNAIVSRMNLQIDPQP